MNRIRKIGVRLALFIGLALASANGAEPTQPWNDPAWKALIHESSPLSHLGFYLSGSSNPESEWFATLKAFATPALPSVPPNEEEDAPLLKPIHPQCIYRDRFEWIQAQYPNYLVSPPIPCAEYENWKQLIRPHRISLVFLEGESELNFHFFGDFFLRFHASELKTSGVPKLDYAVFSKLTPHPVSPIQALQDSIQTQFVTLPWDQVTQQFIHFEFRRLWQWELKLTEAKTDRLVAHLWTLAQFDFTYSMLTNNASEWTARLLSVIDALSVRSPFRMGVFPWRTPESALSRYRNQIQSQDWLSNNFIPSNADRYQGILKNQTPLSQKMTEEFLNEDFSSADPENPETAVSLQMAILKSKVDNHKNLSKKLKRQQLEWGLSSVDAPLIPKLNPLFYPRPSRFALGQGFLKNSGHYSLLKLSVFDHSVRELELKLLNLEARYLLQSRRLNFGDSQWLQWKDWSNGFLLEIGTRPVQIFKNQEHEPFHFIQSGLGRSIYTHSFFQLRGALQWELGVIRGFPGKKIRTGPVPKIEVPFQLHERIFLNTSTEYLVNASGPGGSVLRNLIDFQYRIHPCQILQFKLRNENGFLDGSTSYQIGF